MTTDKPKRPYGNNPCGANKRQGEGTCTRPAGWGTSHPGSGRCKLHGGATPSGAVAAARQQAERDVVLFAARRDIHPAEALLELVQWTAGEVDYWRSRVNELAGENESGLTWGVTREKSGGDDHGTTEEAKPAVEYLMLTDASNRLERYAASALRAGADAALVRVAQAQGSMLAGMIRQILDRLELTPVQWELVPSVVPSVLRSVGQQEVTGE